MVRTQIKINEIAYDEFTVVDSSDNLVTGLEDGDFTKYLYNPSGSDVSGTIIVTVDELGDGIYRVNFTPNAIGEWILLLTNTTYFPEGKSDNYLCVYEPDPGKPEIDSISKYLDSQL